MDGGGRFLKPVTAPTARFAGVPAFAGAGSSVGGASFGALVPWRRALRSRSSVRAIERQQPRAPRFAGLAMLVAFFAGVGLYGAVKGGEYEDFVALHGDPRDIVARSIGFGIRKVTISGISELDQTEVLQVAGLDSRGALPFFDVGAARERLLSVPLVKSATVRKLYPDELEIAVTEREPFALWQNHGEVFVVAADGTVIDRLNDPRFNRLPLVVGEGAAGRAKAFTKLMEAAPELRSRVRAGMLVGQRRWTLKLDTGLEVRLPEENAAQAVTRFAALVRDQKLLDRDILAVDMRYPDRVVLRLSEEASDARADLLKSKGKNKGSAI
jgi:cell division protein FtsQ